MREGLREVLPWMAGGISADKLILPVGRGPRVVMPLQRGRVIRTLITEKRPELRKLAAIPDEPVPIVMPDLMSEMAEKGSVWLPHFLARLLPCRIIGFSQRDSYDAAIVPGKNWPR